MKTNAVNIKHGNPFPLQAGETWWASLEKYRAYFYRRLETEPVLRRRIHEPKGKHMDASASCIRVMATALRNILNLSIFKF